MGKQSDTLPPLVMEQNHRQIEQMRMMTIEPDRIDSGKERLHRAKGQRSGPEFSQNISRYSSLGCLNRDEKCKIGKAPKSPAGCKVDKRFPVDVTAGHLCQIAK